MISCVAEVAKNINILNSINHVTPPLPVVPGNDQAIRFNKYQTWNVFAYFLHGSLKPHLCQHFIPAWSEALPTSMLRQLSLCDSLSLYKPTRWSHQYQLLTAKLKQHDFDSTILSMELAKFSWAQSTTDFEQYHEVLARKSSGFNYTLDSTEPLPTVVVLQP